MTIWYVYYSQTDCCSGDFFLLYFITLCTNAYSLIRRSLAKLNRAFSLSLSLSLPSFYSCRRVHADFYLHIIPVCRTGNIRWYNHIKRIKRNKKLEISTLCSYICTTTMVLPVILQSIQNVVDFSSFHTLTFWEAQNFFLFNGNAHFPFDCKLSNLSNFLMTLQQQSRFVYYT